MKKEYINPIVELIEIELEEVIANSPDEIGGDNGVTTDPALNTNIKYRTNLNDTEAIIK